MVTINWPRNGQTAQALARVLKRVLAQHPAVFVEARPRALELPLLDPRDPLPDIRVTEVVRP